MIRSNDEPDGPVFIFLLVMAAACVAGLMYGFEAYVFGKLLSLVFLPEVLFWSGILLIGTVIGRISSIAVSDGEIGIHPGSVVATEIAFFIGFLPPAVLYGGYEQGMEFVIFACALSLVLTLAFSAAAVAPEVHD